MRAIWLTFAAFSFVTAGAVWLFASGWAGGIPWLPDTELLATGEWPLWVMGLILLYGPIAFGGWCLWKAVRNTQ
jgi:hypothetical protein